MQISDVKMVSSGLRRVMVLISLLEVIVGPLLYLFPSHTDTLFAWTILPPLTAMFLGGTYLTALVIVQLSVREKVWANERAIYPGLLLFTILTLLATLLHLDRFHFQSPDLIARLTAWAWLIVYIIVPILMVVFMVIQGRLRGTDPQRRTTLPPGYRLVLFFQSAVMVVLGIALVLIPQLARSLWPWQLTALTSAAIAAWLIGLGVALAQSALENAWERIRMAVYGPAVMGALQLVAAVRFAPVMNWGGAAAWLYAFFCLSLLLAGLYGIRQVRSTA